MILHNEKLTIFFSYLFLFLHFLIFCLKVLIFYYNNRFVSRSNLSLYIFSSSEDFSNNDKKLSIYYYCSKLILLGLGVYIILLVLKLML